MNEFVELVHVLAWPILVTGVLIAFRDPLTHFFGNVGKRLTKVSAFGFDLALEPLVEGNVEALKTEVQELAASTFDSSKNALLEQLGNTAPMDYAIIDLGQANSWLTSRLFIFSVMLKAMRYLQCFVFVETRGDSPRKFIGTALPADVRWKLGEAFPWLEQSFINAYKGQSLDGKQWTLSRGLSTVGATNLVKTYLTGIQQTNAPPPPLNTEWVLVSLPTQPPQLEHAEWLNGSKLRMLLASSLRTSAIEDWKSRSESELGQSVLRKKDPFIALLDADGRFDKLVPRSL
jgi:hypothetical protein